jgi:RHS repeat-associated protein
LTTYGQTYTVGSGFDVVNRKTNITYPDGTLVELAYSDRNQLTQIKYAGSVIDTRTYDPGQRLATSIYGNGIGTTWSYRNANLVSSITRTNLTGADFTYTYDSNKNKTSETISGVVSNYGFSTTSYDNQDRLTSWNRTDGALDQSWNLSKEGDWDSFTENTVTETRSHTGVHELTSIDTTPLTYDSKGNLTTNQNGQTYTWDFDSRMASATVPVGATESIEGTHSYTYDALGRRVSKSGESEDTTVFVCSGQQLMSEYLAGASAAATKEKYVYASYIDDSIVKDGTGGSSYYHRNQQYSVAALTSSTGAAIERYAYNAYGKLQILSASGSPMSSSFVNNDHTYTGRRFEPKTGNYYYRARYYEPVLGRFFSNDPIGFNAGDANLYRYVGNSSTNATDPSGLEEKSPEVTLQFDGEMWTFSGINNWNSERDAYVDYVAEQLRAAGVQASNRGIVSKLGTTSHYKGQSYVKSLLRSESRLDNEAECIAGGIDMQSLIDERAKIAVFMVAPKTDTLVDLKRLRQLGLDISVTIWWSPLDRVPNQELGATEGLEFWEKRGGTVYTVAPLPEKGNSYDQHAFLGFLNGPLRKMHKYRYLNSKGEVRRRFELAPKRAPTSPGLLDALRKANGADYVWVGHSQGCNIISTLLDGTGRK